MKVEKRIDKIVRFGDLNHGDVFRRAKKPNGITYIRCADVVNDDSCIFNAVDIEKGFLEGFARSTDVIVIDGTFVEGR